MKPKFAWKPRILLWSVLVLLGLLAAARGALPAEGMTDAAGPTVFQKVYGGSDHDWANAVAGPLDDGGFLLVGGTDSFGAGSSDIYAVRTDKDGTVLWSKTYGGSGFDWAEDVIVLPDKGFLLVGGTYSFGAGGSDMYVVRIDEDGNVKWSKTYGGSDGDWAEDVIALPDGGFLLVGGTYSFGGGDRDMYVVRVDKDGNVLWNKTYGGSRYEDANAVAGPLDDGGFLLVGTGLSDMYAVRIDKDGNVKWSKTYGGSDGDWAEDVIALPDGGFLLVGETVSFGTGNWDMYAVRIDKDGNVEWSKTYGGSDYDAAGAVAGPLADGGFLLTGITLSFGAGYWDMYAVRIDKDGNLVWSKTYGESDYDRAYDVIALPDGNFLLVGSTYSFYSFEAGRDDMYVVRIDNSGTSGCHETSPATQTTDQAIQAFDLSPQVTTPTPRVISPTTQTSAPSTGTNTLCLLTQAWRLHLPLVLRED